MLNRRQTLLSFAAMAAPTLVTAAPTNATRYYTAKTAPDALTRAILANPILSLDLPQDADAVAAIHSMFPQLIEQNFAQLRGDGAGRLLASMTPDELRALAGAYAAAAGPQGRLLDLFALRLTGRDMGRLTPYFGYEPVYEALWRSAPNKSNEFEQFAATDVASGGIAVMSAGVNVDMTIPEIYLSFRTAPIGSLGVAAALYETAAFASRNLTLAYGSGYAVGTALSWTIQTYAPSLHDAIGSFIYNIVNSISQAVGTSALGQAQATASLSFGLGSLGGTFSSTGGDFLVVRAWQTWSGGGGRGCVPCWVSPL